MDAAKKTLFGGTMWDGSGREARLDDVLRMSNLGAPVSVAEVMNTESDLLCYQYELS